ncbi:putative reverse transcriptase domain-containing protein [Tanacetum coccineum]
MLIKEKLKAARDRQKSYADNRRKPLEFEVGDRVRLKVSPWKGVIRFGKKGKLAPRYVRPFEILERIGLMAYRLKLPKELSGVHDMFHVSNLKKCLANASLHVPLDEIKVDKTLRFVEEPVEIMDHEVKSLKRSKIALVKVRWNSKRGPEFTWEHEDYMKSKLFVKFCEVLLDLLEAKHQLNMGNGESTTFWEDRWLEGSMLKDIFPRLYVLEINKKVSVGDKLKDFRLDSSFRRKAKGGIEQVQYEELSDMVNLISLTPKNDRSRTRWVKYVPIKVNVTAWKIKMDALPTRLNISRRGMDIQSLSCPICDCGVESSRMVNLVYLAAAYGKLKVELRKGYHRESLDAGLLPLISNEDEIRFLEYVPRFREVETMMSMMLLEWSLIVRVETVFPPPWSTEIMIANRTKKLSDEFVFRKLLEEIDHMFGLENSSQDSPEFPNEVDFDDVDFE